MPPAPCGFDLLVIVEGSWSSCMTAEFFGAGAGMGAALPVATSPLLGRMHEFDDRQIHDYPLPLRDQSLVFGLGTGCREQCKRHSDARSLRHLRLQ